MDNEKTAWIRVSDGWSNEELEKFGNVVKDTFDCDVVVSHESMEWMNNEDIHKYLKELHELYEVDL